MMAHGIARLSLRLRRKKGSQSQSQNQSQTQAQAQAQPTTPDRAGPASSRDESTSQLQHRYQHHQHHHHHHPQSQQPQSHPAPSSSLPTDHLSSADDIASRGAAASISASSIPGQHSQRDQEAADKPDEEGPSPRRNEPQHTTTSKSVLDVKKIFKRDSGQEPPPTPSSTTDRATSCSLTGSQLLGKSTNLSATTTAANVAPSPNTLSLSQESCSRPHNRRAVSSATSTSIPSSSLQTVDEGDGASPTAISPINPNASLKVGGVDVDNEDEDKDKDKEDDGSSTPFGNFIPGQHSSARRPTIAIRKQSLLPQSQQYLVNRVLEGGSFHRDSDPFVQPYSAVAAQMAQRKVWVKRPDASATLVSMSEDSVVDELRDHVLRKYSNSLGKTYDSPDLTVRICPRITSNRPPGPDRILSPEESLFALIDQYYPGGQTMDEALVIEAPPRRTPMKPSPRQSYYYHAEPGEQAEYFPLMPVPINVGTPPGHPPSSNNSNMSAHQTPSMSVLTTGKVHPLPSPGSRPNRHSRRPPFVRHATGSPTLIASSKDSNIAVNGQTGSSQHSLPTPPAPAAPQLESPTHNLLNSNARTSSPRPVRKPKKVISPSGGAFGGLIEGTVPPINVLIVEDNVINQKLLEAFMKRLSVRWQCAPNGEVAVKKWRQGGFHLVLMDIQLPVMNGLDATKEIRRLERLNGIGVFSKTASGRTSAASTSEPRAENPVTKEDTLEDLSLFKSPVIIVALTASSLQSDRHEALAAGCNDFLTKPIGFPWLEQKVTEWGCMQALIDFEGWRKWRGYEDSPRNISSIKTESNSPSPSRNNAVPAVKVYDSKEGSKVSVLEPDSSGSSSSKDEDAKVPGPVESATAA